VSDLTSGESQSSQALTDDDSFFSTLTRRTLIARVLPAVAVAVAGGAALGRAAGVEAGITWCRTDPVITVNEKTFHVYVLSTQAMFQQRTGPTEIIVKYPQGTTATGKLLPNDKGFGLGYNLNLQSTSGLSKSGTKFQIKVAVRVGANDNSLPVRMDAERPNGTLLATKTATANNWFESSAFWI
jgi:hypothetical protein